jgi:hypothetical protein
LTYQIVPVPVPVPLGLGLGPGAIQATEPSAFSNKLAALAPLKREGSAENVERPVTMSKTFTQPRQQSKAKNAT